MKSTLLIALSLTLSFAAQAKTYNCVGKELVKGALKLTLEAGRSEVSGSYAWTEASGEDTKERVVDCTGAEHNAGRSGNKTHDYYDMNRACDFDYIRTQKDMEKAKTGWIQLSTAGPADHDSPGYSYASFLCK
jgi:hypothetical protein